MGWSEVGNLGMNMTESAVDKVHFSDSPFKTVLGVMAPIAAWRVSPLLGIFFLMAEAVGIGPGMIGGWVDQALNFKGSNTKPVLSFSDVADAASKVVDAVFNKAGGYFNSMTAKSHLNQEEKEAFYKIAHVYHSNGIHKTAVGRAFLGPFFKGFVAKRGTYRMGVIKYFTGFLWTFLKGLLAAGAIGGISKTIAGKKTTITDPNKFLPNLPFGKTQQTRKEVAKPHPSGLEYYVNNRGTVQDSLINYFNINMAYFSNAFYNAKGRQLYNSPEMLAALSGLEKYNHMPISQLNNERTFVAPRLDDLAKKILPNHKFVDLDVHKPKDTSLEEIHG